MWRMDEALLIETDFVATWEEDEGQFDPPGLASWGRRWTGCPCTWKAAGTGCGTV